MNIVFTGMKHCGKSTQGRLLAEKLQCKFVDSDAELERNYQALYGKKLLFREIYQQHGADFFRKLEADSIADLLLHVAAHPTQRTVFALGGGTVSNPFLPDDWRNLGLIVYLKADAMVLYNRIVKGGLPPYLCNCADPFAEFLKVSAARNSAFEQAADMVFEFKMPQSKMENHELLYGFLKTEIEE